MSTAAGAVSNEGGRIAMLRCPVCLGLTVISPFWLPEVGKTMDHPCENCWDECRPHLIVEAQLLPEFIIPPQAT